MNTLVRLYPFSFRAFHTVYQVDFFGDFWFDTSREGGRGTFCEVIVEGSSFDIDGRGWGACNVVHRPVLSFLN